MKNKRCILFNGPRHSGKDTAALHLEAARDAHHFKFSAPLKAATRAFFGLEDGEVEFLESIKTAPVGMLFGKSYVEVQISLSEDWAKKFWDPNFFGNLAAYRLAKSPAFYQHELFVCSDSGFASEAQAIVELFGPENVLLVSLYRDGKTYEGDSRSYIDLPEVSRISLTNNGQIPAYLRDVEFVADQWLNGIVPFE